ncbi:hypothetical protein [Aquimarina sp. 2201CG14-23]|uniref:hypothetical protein n=1 Tax=Aquimarina mycalae TaxID=3040073 RepID=UPI00247803DA|nr:hypothetical protein [Aquimarina sp. 2201CG14-23]MDH7445719.1 hypothetical protein [Aquimarina sp. 2201CG14-23]
MGILQKFNKIVFTVIVLISTINMYGQGPNAPEAGAFEPIDAMDMIDLVSGDISYVVPLLNIPSPEGGYPIALSYHGGIGYDQEASWIGLGWNINPGSINRNVMGYPDDWKHAKIRETEFFKYTSQSITSSGGWGAWDFSVGYSADSNKTMKGETSVGVSSQSSSASARLGASYGNDSGLNGSIGLGYGKGRVGIGVQLGTDGLVSAGIRGSFAKGTAADDFGSGSIGISFSSRRGKSNVSVGFSMGGQSHSVSSSRQGTMKSHSYGLSAYYAGFKGSLGYSKTTMTINKKSNNFVYGPLYYSEMTYINGADGSYGNEIANEQNRDIFMDSYSQKLPQLEKDFVAFEDIYDKQKNDFTYAAYDNYVVNAQGLSGSIKPFLLESGMIVNEGHDIEYSFEPTGGQTNGWWDCYGVPNLSPEALGTPYRSDRILVNSHYPSSSYKFKKQFGTSSANSGGINFYFENQFPANLNISPQEINTSNYASNLESYISSSYNAINTRSQSGNFVETFTNAQIEVLKSQNNFLEAKGYDRTQDEGFRDHGIGGYRITTADGKTYHYSRPVYHFEEFYRQLYPKNINNSEVYDEYGEDNGCFLCADNGEYYHEKRKEEPYATHWYLTSITGPDYVKKDVNRSYPDEGDYGYWVRFDYGKWTDGYVWRNPYDGYIDLSITKDKTAKEYSWGRKQLVYLDKIVTRTHTALFVKSIRKDNKGKNVGGDPRGFPSHENDKTVNYVTQKPLKLNEIILLSNEYYDENYLNESSQHTSIATEGTHYVNWTSMADKNYSINQQSKILDTGDFLVNSATQKYQIYEKAEKIIKFDHSYELAQQSLNSTSNFVNDQGERGRLTLNEVKTLGRNGYDYMPGYKFDYIGKDVNYSQCLKVEGCEKDPWGFNGNNPSLWALNQITAPTGGKIQIEYEEDEYWTEAFSRRYWTNGLEFKIFKDGGSLLLEIKKDHWNDASLDDINFTDYFDPNEQVYLDYWFCTHDEDWKVFEGCVTNVFRVNIPPQGYIPHLVETNRLVFKFNYWDVVGDDSGKDQVLSRAFAKHHDYFSGTIEYHAKDRGQCHDESGCGGDSWNVVYNLLANRVPGSGTGGGIRVASLASIDENNNIYKTKYDYNHPIKNRTSGITSYAPIRSEKYVAYQSELPAPRVTYEYVTASDVDINDRVISSRQYHFNVLTPALNIFDENMEIDNIFKASVVNNAGNNSSYIDSGRKTISNQILLKDNTASIGNTLETTVFNEEGHIMSKQLNEYLNLEELEYSTMEKPGVLQESFFNMKSVYNYYKNTIHGSSHTPIYETSVECVESEGRVLRKRLINSSSKIIYPVVHKRSIQIQNGIKQTEEYSNIDPKTGGFLTVKSQLADGSFIKTEQVPAYTKYPEMGSKVDDPTNKHMLTQETMNLSYWSYNGSGSSAAWKTLNANITTWNNSWNYIDYKGNETQLNDVWRKHKSFVWKDDIDETTGAYVTNVNKYNNYFDWAIGTPTDQKWNNVSETTRYTHWSSPLENKDINGNYVSSKMAKNNTLVVTSGNASYTELYASGAEYNIDGEYLDQGIEGANLRDESDAHTGQFSLRIGAGDKGFKTRMRSDEYAKDNYKISVWANSLRAATMMRLNINGKLIAFNGEIVQAGRWYQFNHYEFLDGSDNTLYLTLSEQYKGVQINIDDFRIHPVYASVNTYVYDQYTDELTYILDANNMAVKYEYDNAGRLSKQYKEVKTDMPGTNGGFKLINQYKYNYNDSN